MRERLKRERIINIKYSNIYKHISTNYVASELEFPHVLLLHIDSYVAFVYMEKLANFASRVLVKNLHEFEIETYVHCVTEVYGTLRNEEK